MRLDNNIYDIISRYVLGQANEEELKELDRWLAESPRHQQVLDKFLSGRDMSRLFSIPASHKDARRAFDTFAPKSGKSSFLHIMPSRWLTVSIAAVAAIFISVIWWYKYTEVIVPQLSDEYLAAMSLSQKTGRSDADIVISSAANAAASHIASAKNITDESTFDAFLDNLTAESDIDEKNLQAQVVTHHDKEFWLTLPDGSRVHLNYGCRLTYPLQFTGDKREVALDGEAYFIVAKDRRHPFVVHTPCGDVKEYGTEFVVNTRYNSSHYPTPTTNHPSSKNGVSVVLIEGSISVTPSTGKERMMKPSDMALLSGSSSVPDIQQVDTTPFVAWNTGTFAFDNCPLEQLLGVLSHWYNIQVDYAGENSCRQSTFTGELDRYNDVASGVRAINKVTGLKLRIVDNTIVVE